MKVALIGGAGFIGSHLSEFLAKHGHEVLIVDSLAINNKFTVLSDPRLLKIIEFRLEKIRESGIQLVCIDARDYHQLSHIVAPFAPDVIVHMAAVAHIDRAHKDPLTTFDHNLRTLENALDIARALDNTRFVFFSSSTAYGDFQKPTIDETEPCKPTSIYGSLKYAGEILVNAYRQAYGMKTTIVRPCAVYGPGCISGRVTQKFMELAADGKPLTIQGDGGGRHDFTYIDDLVDGVFRVLTRHEAAGETFNITAGDARSLNSLANIIRERYPDTEIIYGEADPDKLSRGTMSVEKAFRLLGYIPRFSLERGMQKYMDWHGRT